VRGARRPFTIRYSAFVIRYSPWVCRASLQDSLFGIRYSIFSVALVIRRSLSLFSVAVAAPAQARRVRALHAPCLASARALRVNNPRACGARTLHSAFYILHSAFPPVAPPLQDSLFGVPCSIFSVALVIRRSLIDILRGFGCSAFLVRYSPSPHAAPS
jgi:hypothetical protein